MVKKNGTKGEAEAARLAVSTKAKLEQNRQITRHRSMFLEQADNEKQEKSEQRQGQQIALGFFSCLIYTDTLDSALLKLLSDPLSSSSSPSSLSSSSWRSPAISLGVRGRKALSHGHRYRWEWGRPLPCV